MKTLILLLLVASLMSGCHWKKPYQVPNIPPDQLPINQYYAGRLEEFSKYQHQKVAMLGDSLTAGGNWDQLLGEKVLNFGIKSDNSISMLHRLEQVVKVRPDVCFVLIGTNQYKNHYLWNDLLEARRRLLEAGIRPVLTTIPFVEKAHENASNMNYGAKLMNERIRESGFEYIDLNRMTKKGDSLDSELTLDGVHLNEKGYRRWATLILSYLNK